MRYLPTIILLVLYLLLVIAAFMPHSTRVGRAMRSLTRRSALTNLFVGCFAFILVGANALWMRHVPDFHDEFSFLLMADTFASGRLTNPSPPLPEHFEAPHVLLQPTYASKYPVMNGIIMALGQAIGGDPFLGVQLGFAIFCALGCWMMQAFVPPRWAFVGGMLLVMHPYLVFSESGNWTATYWGGSMAASGSALLYGSIARLRRDPSAFVFVGIGLGLLVLANSRPYEGVVASLPAGVVFLRWFLAQVRQNGPAGGLRKIAPLLATVLIGAGLMAVYFKAVTGNPLKMPYFEHDQRYAVAPSFWFQELRPTPPIYLLPDGTLDPVFDRRYRFHFGWEVDSHRSHSSFFESSLGIWQNHAIYYALPTPLLLIGAGWMFRSGRTWLNVMVVLSLFFATLWTTWNSPRYLAPLAAPMMLLAVQGMRVWCIARPFGRWVSWIILLLTLGLWCGLLIYTGSNQWWRANRVAWNFERAEIQQSFEQREGKHLIFVDPDAPYNPHTEYIYNKADILNGKVVWARSLGPERDAALRAHFPNHQVWLFQPWEPKLQRLD